VCVCVTTDVETKMSMSVTIPHDTWTEYGWAHRHEWCRNEREYLLGVQCCDDVSSKEKFSSSDESREIKRTCALDPASAFRR
jgi:hypothetical protein